MRCLQPCVALALASVFIACPSDAVAVDWHVAAHGKKDGRGTVWAPWDLESALSGQHPIAPGDTVWIGPGTYRFPDRRFGSAGFVVRLAGAPGQPVRVRGQEGARVTVDGGLTVQTPSDHLWIQDLEILVSENSTMPRELAEPGSSPQSYGRPWGGLNIHAGTHCLYLNLVIHDNAQGVSFWSGAKDSELNGCIIYDNGWKAPDRGHGHAIYTQNQTGIKTIRDCIMTGGFGYTMHAYGSSRAYVDHYLAEGNICYEAGTFLIGGARPSSDIRVRNNVLFHVPMRIGYGAPSNEDCEIRENVIVGAELQVVRYRQVQQEGNLILDKDAPRPTGEEARVILRPSRYDSRRCHVAVFNWSRKPVVAVDCAEFLKEGDEYQLMDPRHFYEAPVREGTFHGPCIEVPVAGEFAAFVLLKTKGTGVFSNSN